jgi:outer membrane protein insertion porin family
MTIKNIIVNNILFLILYNFLFLSVSFSEILKTINISGNTRISNESIFTFLPVKIDEEINNEKINNITKELYQTNFFKDIEVQFIDGELLINVSENPIIQSITFNGVKSNTLKNSITENLRLTDRSSFIELFVEQDIFRMNNNLKSRGYYYPKIIAKIEKLENNAVNLIYDIDIGEKTKIKKITFIGDKIYKDRKLKGIILSEEYKFWKFISGKKYLNEDLINFDQRLLRNFYLNNGYYNVSISSSFAKIIDEDDFELIFNINSGKKFFFGDLTVSLPLNYEKQNFIKLNETLNKLEGKKYSINSIDEITQEIDLIALNEQYESITIDVLEEIDDNKLNLKFIINETEKSFVKKINILGNNVTRESVIRNEFEIDEGDFFNEILYNKTINNLKSLNFFKSVNGKVTSNTVTNDKTIDISVEEKPTGEIGASLGFGTDSNSVGFFVKENNYLGKGLGVEANIQASTDRIKGLLSIENPKYNDSDKSVYGSIESLEIDKSTDYGYKTNRTGFSYGTRFEIFDDLFFGLGSTNFYEDIQTDSTASALQRAQQGDYWDTFVNLDFTLDKRNQKFKPSDGFRTSYNVQLPVISDTNTLTNTYNYNYFTELYENNVTAFSFFLKTANSISNDNVKLTERIFLPASKLRGFRSGGVGPKDGNDYIGGNYATSVNLSTSLPQILPEYQSVDFVLFFDAGNVFGVDYNSSIDKSDKIRSSAGIGVDWLTPVGPLSLSLSETLSKADTDTTESFRFNLGTSF